MTGPPIAANWAEAGRRVTLTSLHLLPESHIVSLAGLHMTTTPTLLTDLGRPVVLRFYQLAHNDPSVIGICAIGQPEPLHSQTTPRLVGYAVGSPNPSALYARLRRPIHWFAGQLLRLAVTRPRVLIQLVRSARSASNQLAPGQIELTYIGVAPEARGQGLGHALLDAFLEASREAGRASVGLSVETDNLPAVALYTKAGFAVSKTFSEGRYQRYRMELCL